MKKVYFAWSIRGDQQLTSIYPFIIAQLKENGYEVITENLNRQHATNIKENPSDEDIFVRDVNLINEADILVAEVSSPSHGVGREICYAQFVRKIPVYLLSHHDKNMSAMLNGNLLINFAESNRKCLWENQKDIQEFIAYLK